MPHLQPTAALITAEKIRVGSTRSSTECENIQAFEHWRNALKGVGTMSKKNCLPVGAAICVLAGLFAITTNDTAAAASGCLASPNRESGPSTHWHYRI